MNKSLLCLLMCLTVVGQAQGLSAPFLSWLAGYTVLTLHRPVKLERVGYYKSGDTTAEFYGNGTFFPTMAALVGGYVVESVASNLLVGHLFNKLQNILNNPNKEQAEQEKALFVARAPIYNSLLSAAGIIGTAATAYAIRCAST